MPYTGTYAAFVRYSDGTPEKRWEGLRRTQAKWRYHWIARRYGVDPEYRNARQWGWEREWQA